VVSAGPYSPKLDQRLLSHGDAEPVCAIAMFMLCCRGYDLKDEIAGIFSSLCALGVAFFPTTPDLPTTKLQYEIGTVHYTFAALLFLTLAYFCLVLFKMSAEGKRVTPQKQQRNRVYTICGCAIIASILLIVISKVAHLQHLVGNVGPVFCLETTALIAFGIAWLTKGETFLKDEDSEPSITKTTDGRILYATSKWD
jgi:hypothetical protein